MNELGGELCQLMADFLGEMGVARKERGKMMKGAALRTGKRPKPSAAVLHKFLALSDMLSLWRSGKRYTGVDGAPRVLPIYGKGASLETLARKYLPQTPLPEVIRIICMQGEVQQYKDDKVALVGSNLLIHEKNAEQALASFVSRVRALASNCVYNINQPLKSRAGYFDRQVTGVLSENAFRKYSQEVRPQLQDLCDHVEAGLQLPSNADRGKKGKACGLALFLFREDGKLF
jgi:hypothetical protein